MKKIGIFYGPAKSRTAVVAEKIQNLLGADKADIYPVNDVTIDTLSKYDKLIFGVSTLGSETWDGEDNTNQWGSIMPKLKRTNLKGKKIALFGLGDHITYAAKFVDAIGEMANVLQTKEAEIVGHVSRDGYTFTDSKALKDGRFVGLPLDEDYESEKTDSRIANWVEILKKTLLD
ncbi:MAG: flavodoxin [Salinivirgaceae bacterium]|nr:flavodoxin [Salinivirgaceae bacterium]MDD4746953.1 flavodoxin [Salinivirgaceae bacterium]MDY0279463.1 flavodoxin [Salinivirgaceae bacterium]